MTAPTGDASNELDEYPTEAQIDALHLRLKGTPEFSPTAVDNFIEVLRKFRKETPEKEKIVGVVSEVHAAS